MVPHKMNGILDETTDELKEVIAAVRRHESIAVPEMPPVSSLHLFPDVPISPKGSSAIQHMWAALATLEGQWHRKT